MSSGIVRLPLRPAALKSPPGNDAIDSNQVAFDQADPSDQGATQISRGTLILRLARIHDRGTSHPRLLRVRVPFGKLIVKPKGGVRIDAAALFEAAEGD